MPYPNKLVVQGEDNVPSHLWKVAGLKGAFLLILSLLLNACTTPEPVIIAPNMPTNFRISGASEASVHLVWDVADATTYYVLERSAVGAYPEYLTKLSSTDYTDDSLEPDTAYLYHLRAGNAGGESERITLGVVTKPAKPNKPAHLEAMLVTPVTVTLSWDYDLTVSSYSIERAEEGHTFIEIARLGGDKAQENAYADRDLKSATLYRYRVGAINVSGTSEAAEIETSTATVLESQDAGAAVNLTLEGAGEGRLLIGNKPAIPVASDGRFSYSLSKPDSHELESVSKIVGQGSCEPSDSSASLVLAKVRYKESSNEQSVIAQSIDAKLHMLEGV